MSLEDDLKQTKRFVNEYEKTVVNILFTSSWLHNKNACRFKKHGITQEQYNVLRILRGSYPKSLMLNDISGRMIDKSSNATRLVEKLRQKEMLKREVCPGNRRQVDIVITEKGLALLAQIDNESEGWFNELNTISLEEANELNRILDKLRK